MTLGILFAFGALFFWGFGDYFIQKSTREVGDWETLFYNGLFGLIMLFPFVYREIPTFLSISPQSILLFSVAAITFVAALFEFEALKEGKLSVIEPVLGTELVFTVFLSIWLLNESLSLAQLFLIALCFVGIMLAVTRNFDHLKYHKRFLERGVLIAIMGAITMGVVNFMTGVTARETSPLLTMWAVEAFLMVACAIYLIFKKRIRGTVSDLVHHPKYILAQSFFDNLAWVSFAYALVLIPISVATTISESYIILTVFLGIHFNKEKIKPHQKIGAALAVVGILALSFLT